MIFRKKRRRLIRIEGGPYGILGALRYLHSLKLSQFCRKEPERADFFGARQTVECGEEIVESHNAPFYTEAESERNVD